MCRIGFNDKCIRLLRYNFNVGWCNVMCGFVIKDEIRYVIYIIEIGFGN